MGELIIPLVIKATNVPEGVTQEHIREYLRAFIENDDKPRLSTEHLDAMPEIQGEMLSMEDTPMGRVLDELVLARRKHPVFARSYEEMQTVLSAEVGEVADAILDRNKEGLVIELAQVGAVALRGLEYVTGIPETAAPFVFFGVDHGCGDYTATWPFGGVKIAPAGDDAPHKAFAPLVGLKFIHTDEAREDLLDGEEGQTQATLEAS